MKCVFFSDAAGFLNAAAGFLAQNEAENTVLVGRALHCVRRPKSDVVMAVVQNGDGIGLAAIMTPPHALVLSAGGSETVAYLVEALCAARVRPPGVSGAEQIAARFAELWSDREPAAAAFEMRMILFRADRIAAPRNIPGRLRTATAHDVDWLAAWQRRFIEQTDLSAAERAADMRGVVAARVSQGEMVYWSVEGRPVSSAAYVPTTPAADAGRINAVFTFEEERGKGYASACVAALSRRLLGRGWRYCLIFADRNNPTTTRIYPRLGYREIAGFATIGFRYDK